MIFKSRTRRKVEIEILKLRLHLADIEREKVKTHDTSGQVDLIMRKHAIEHDIELYKKLL